ncbi:hypothetical protein ACQEVF_53660 [Nonomuraea polychroma]|uniref:hypothetical protein n=1 Tax=Nonomuraea polychroma TaxID=46176 RepID=UPI003D938BAC
MIQRASSEATEDHVANIRWLAVPAERGQAPTLRRRDDTWPCAQAFVLAWQRLIDPPALA